MKRSITRILILILIIMCMGSVAFGVVTTCTDHICTGKGNSLYAQGHNNRHEVGYTCTDPSHTFTTEMYCWTCKETRNSDENGWHDFYCTVCNKKKNTGGPHNTANACPECGKPNLSCDVCGHTVIHLCVPSAELSDAIAPIVGDVTVPYDGLAHTIQVVGGSGGTKYYSLTGTGNWMLSLPTRTEVGSTTIYVMLVGDSNHNDSEIVHATITITKPDIFPIVEIESYTYGGEVSVPTLTGNKGSGDVTYYYRQKGTTEWQDFSEVDSGIYLVVGNYELYAHVDATDSYNAADSNITEFYIAKKDIVPLIAMQNYEYGCEVLPEPSFIGSNPESGDVTYYYNATNSNINGFLWSTVNSTKFLDVGTYYMYAIIQPTANYNGATSPTVSFTVSKSPRTEEFGAKPIIIGNDYTYNVSEVPEPMVENNLENGAVTFYYSTSNTINNGTLWQNMTGTTLPAGIYYMYATVGETANYGQGTTDTFEFIVSPDEARNPTLTNITVEYDGLPHTIGIGNDSYGGTIQYAINLGEWVTSLPSFTNIGTYQYTVKVIGDTNYTDSAEVDAYLIINPKLIEDIGTDVTLTTSDYTYNGQEIYPEPVVKIGANTLQKDVDYVVTYSDNIHVGKATLTITGMGNYTGSVDVQFNIVPATITIKAPDLVIPYGTEIPSFDYTITGNAAGDVVALRGNYETGATGSSAIGTYDINKGTLEFDPTQMNVNDYSMNYQKGSITISTMNITDSSIACEMSESDVIYEGKDIKPEVVLYRRNDPSNPLVNGIDYSVTYTNNKNVGQATVTISGINNYSGTITKHFNIVKRTLIVMPNALSKKFGKPDPTLTYSYQNNAEGEIPGFTGVLSREPGNSIGVYEIYKNTLALAVNGNFNPANYTMDFLEGQVFTILSASIDDYTCTISPTSYDYDGNAKTPTVTIVTDTGVTLVRARDYILSYRDNINVGTGKAIVEGINDYIGTIELTFTINQVTIEGNVTVKKSNAVPTPGEILSADVNITRPSTAELVDVQLTYQWYTNTANTTTGGVAIEGETMNRLVLTEDMVDKYIYVVVNATMANHGPATFTNKLNEKVVERTPPTTPVITAKIGSSTGANYTSGTWTNQPVWINVKSDENYQIKRYEYSTTSQSAGFSTIGTLSNNQASMLVSGNKDKVTYYFRTVDYYDNVSDVATIVIAIDTIKPTIASLTPDVTIWTHEKVTMTGTVSDDLSGVAGYFFGATNGNSYTNIDPELNTTISQAFDANVNNYYFGIIDQAGNKEYTTFSINNIDTINPTLQVTEEYTDSTRTLNIRVSDTQSGIKEVTVNGQNVTLSADGDWKYGSYVITDGGVYKVIAYDIAENTSDYTRTVYAVRYSSNGVNGSMDSQLKLPGESVVIKTCPFVNPNYSFVKWNTKEDGTGQDYNPGATYSLDQSVTLYAVWSPIQLSLGRVDLDSFTMRYTGSEVTPQVRVYNNYGELLHENEDYTLEYKNNINVGVASIIITGINRYDGQFKEETFRIYGTNINEANLQIEPLIYTYDGYEKRPTVRVNYGTDILVNGKDYIIIYSNNVNAGTASVVVEGRGDFYGTKSTEFTIQKADRKAQVYNVALIKNERIELEYTYKGPKVNDTLVCENTAIATVQKTSASYYLTGKKAGETKLTFTIPADDNYNGYTKELQVIVFDTKEEAKPLFGTVVIDDDAKEAVTPRMLLSLRASCAEYMYISTNTTKPTLDNANWFDYSTKMPYVFDDVANDDTPEERNIYVWFKDDNGNISDMATDKITLNKNMDYPAHDQIMLDKTEIDKTQPDVEFVELLPTGATMDVIFNQKDKMVNSTRSGVDNATIKYGYKKKGVDDDYVWNTDYNDNRFTGLTFETSYIVVTQAIDRAGNGPTISDEYEFVTPSKYTTSLTLHDTIAQSDGTIHHIDPPEFEIFGDKEPAGTITYTYYTDRECTKRTTPENSGSEEVGGAPSKRGTYYVIATLTNDPTYHDAVSNVGKLHIGWYIDRNDEKKIFAYVEETATDSGYYELVVTGKGATKEMSQLVARYSDPDYSYWANYMDKITKLTLGDATSNIQVLGVEVFSGLTELRAINLPNTIVEIGDRAFAGDSKSINVITIPGTVEKIGENPFADVSTPRFEMQYGNNSYDVVNGVLLTKDHKQLVSYPAGSPNTTYTIPNDVRDILTSAFEGTDYLEDVILQDNIKNIAPKSFIDCANLSRIEIFDLKDDEVKDLANVGDKAFWNIKSNSEIYTFSKKIADMIIADRDYEASKTTVYWPPEITLHPVDMNAKAGLQVKFIAGAKDGYVEGLNYEWHKQTASAIQPGVDPVVSGGYGATTFEYTTPSLTSDDNGSKYYCVIWNMPYYHEKGYSHTNAGTIRFIEHANFAVERSFAYLSTNNTYYFDTLQDAFDFAQNNDNVKQLNDVTNELEAILTGNKTITFTNDNCNLEMAGKIIIEEGSSMEIIGSGTTSRNSYDNVIEVAGKLIINDEDAVIANASGKGINCTRGAELEFISGKINTKSTAITATNATVNMTGSTAQITVNADTSEKAVVINDYTKFTMDNGSIEISSTAGTRESIVGIYNNGRDDVNEGKGRLTINGGTITVAGVSGINGDGIVNANSADTIMNGGKIDATRSGIYNSSSNKYGDVIMTSGTIVSQYVGILNNADTAKVILGTHDESVSETSPNISAETVAIFNPNRNNTLEFYDGILTTNQNNNNSLIIYETINNNNLNIDSLIKQMVYSQEGRLPIITEDGYSINARVEGNKNVATLERSLLPVIAELGDVTVEEGEQATLEVIIETPGHPDSYEYEWEVSIDGGVSWHKVTSGVGINGSKYTTQPVALSMNNNLYRCKVTNRAGITYTNAAKLTVLDNSLYKDQKPYVRVIYKNDLALVNYEDDSDINSDRYVDMEIIIKSFAPLQNVKFSYDSDKNREILGIGGISKSSTGDIYAMQEQDLIEVQRTPTIKEYTYTWDVQAFKNGIITVRAIDEQKREHTDSQTIEAIYDLKISYEKSNLSDINNRLIITFFANKPVTPYYSATSSMGNDAYTKLKSASGTNYSYKFTFTPTEAMDETRYYFEDENNNKAFVDVEKFIRIAYRDIRFTSGFEKDIDDLTVVEAYKVAQNLEVETEINNNSIAQTRYGLNQSQADMFMARARDVGAVEMLSNASTSRTFDGYYIKDINTSTEANVVYNYSPSIKNNYLSAVTNAVDYDDVLRREGSNYVDVITDPELYKGADITDFRGDATQPYMYETTEGKAINIKDEIKDASFRAVIVGN